MAIAIALAIATYIAIAIASAIAIAIATAIAIAIAKTNFALQLKGWRENMENFCGSKPPEGGCGSRQAQGFYPLWQPTASVFHGNRRFADCDPIAQFDRFDPRTTIGLPLEVRAVSRALDFLIPVSEALPQRGTRDSNPQPRVPTRSQNRKRPNAQSHRANGGETLARPWSLAGAERSTGSPSTSVAASGIGSPNSGGSGPSCKRGVSVLQRCCLIFLSKGPLGRAPLGKTGRPVSYRNFIYFSVTPSSTAGKIIARPDPLLPVNSYAARALERQQPGVEFKPPISTELPRGIADGLVVLVPRKPRGVMRLGTWGLGSIPSYLSFNTLQSELSAPFRHFRERRTLLHRAKSLQRCKHTTYTSVPAPLVLCIWSGVCAAHFRRVDHELIGN
ncbi:Lipoprotein signal peptidase [Frankliniella fusca]|uniref:Lipoprotein signal peptidase n=1 Tax=Frankliniella fusca TaxID=407009 RepID=A0AAE1H4I8_9NEOP|nr:Lipoprotein signal peptidase [Frankliniella fusca]